jgi:N-acetylglutamate synthase-like GNAT family acetyltransferase
MQIRLGTRQDEPAIRALVEAIMKQYGLTYDESKGEADLKNIEAHYFAHDGIFLVAEQDGQVVGIAGARASEEKLLELVRFGVGKQWRGKGIARQLMATVVKFARDMENERIVVEPARQYPGGAEFLARFAFSSESSEDAQKPWYYAVER